jgi:hypothetical protein
MSVTLGRLAVICQLLGTGWRLSVSYLRQNDAYQYTDNLPHVIDR